MADHDELPQQNCQLALTLPSKLARQRAGDRPGYVFFEDFRHEVVTLDHWDLLLIRNSVLRDLAEFVPENYYQGLPSDDEKIPRADGELGKMLYFSHNPKMTLKQRAASDVLMQVGLNRGYAWLVKHADFTTEAERDDARQNLLSLERDLEGVLRRYALFLPDSDAEPLLAILPITLGQKPRSVDWGMHTTPALDALKHAVAVWWENHDPEKPPKSEIVVSWLMKEYGLSRRLAEATDSIIRSPEARKGGNKRV